MWEKEKTLPSRRWTFFLSFYSVFNSFIHVILWPLADERNEISVLAMAFIHPFLSFWFQFKSRMLFDTKAAMRCCQAYSHVTEWFSCSGRRCFPPSKSEECNDAMRGEREWVRIRRQQKRDEETTKWKTLSLLQRIDILPFLIPKLLFDPHIFSLIFLFLLWCVHMKSVFVRNEKKVCMLSGKRLNGFEVRRSNVWCLSFLSSNTRQSIYSDSNQWTPNTRDFIHVDVDIQTDC